MAAADDRPVEHRPVEHPLTEGLRAEHHRAEDPWTARSVPEGLHGADHPAEGLRAGGRTADGTVAAGGDGSVDDRTKGRIITDAPLSRPVPVSLRYDPAFSPATVRFGFPGSVEWSFPRALLETGLRAPTRRGDIGVWPCGRVQTVVELHTEDGVTVVQFDSQALRRFLRHTYASGTRTPSAPR
ncbi:SsgA family sporulation/cell division regulator [Streptomyces sp. NPDC093249]|uniref:SsgA family sporulation/cell division regulator n=1 Tax=unclassified Streptomyces TaxID=2593676 RepID=UPI003823311F